MEEELVTSYRASRLLGRDRQTIQRAVDRLAPDAFDAHDRPRWYLSRIAEALAKSPRERRESSRVRDRYRLHSKELDGLIAEFEKQVAAISAEPSLDKRRQMAVTLAPLLAEYQATYLDVGRSHRIDDDALGARTDLIWGEMMEQVSEAAQWPRDGCDFFAEMFAAQWPDAEDEEVVG
ncbi:hypothetical protein [Bradyrhizobium sp. STM 3562]|uniref:hypothetical protein n=1 Tax=Bradyrhizobium sp. STM 3562 TaxID=578924 RepID=UPI00388F8148